MQSSLALRVLNAHFVFESDDARWARLMSALWEPFVIGEPPPDALRCTVRASETGWVAQLGDTRLEETDAWMLADAVRAEMVDVALSLSTEFLDLHAGAVSDERGALLLAGASGAGKSTLTLEFVRRGWGYLSDDLVPIDVAIGSIVPFPKPLGIRSVPAWTEFRANWDPPFEVKQARGSLLIPAPALGAPAGPGTKPRWLVFPRFDHGAEMTLTPTTTAHAVARCGQFMRAMDPTRLSALLKLFQSIPCAELVYNDAPTAVDLLLEWIEAGR